MKNSGSEHIRHRHFVVSPVFALVVALSFVQMPTHVTADVVPESDTVEHVGGSQLYFSDDHLRITIEDIELSLFDGAAHVVRTEGAVTVSALTSPVAVVNGQDRMIVPVGMQWSTTQPAPVLLPRSFLERNLEGLEPSSRSLTLDELDARSADESVWMITSMHPQYAEMAWVTSDRNFSFASDVARIYSQPWSMLTAPEYSEFLFERFTLAVADILSEAEDTEALIEELIQAHAPLVSTLKERGYPKRAQMLSDYIRDLVDSVLEPTESMQNVIREMGEAELVDISSVPVLDEEETEETGETGETGEVEEVLSPEHVEAVAHELLSEADAIYTLHTVVSSYEPNEARITDIVFGGVHQDRTASFTLNVVTGNVRDIEIDGQTDFPYEPSFDGFTRWVRK